MRISTQQLQQQGINSMLEQQSKLGKTQLQVSTGRRILTPADDPAASSQVLGLTQAKEADDFRHRAVVRIVVVKS